MPELKIIELHNSIGIAQKLAVIYIYIYIFVCLDNFVEAFPPQVQLVVLRSSISLTWLQPRNANSLISLIECMLTLMQIVLFMPARD